MEVCWLSVNLARRVTVSLSLPYMRISPFYPFESSFYFQRSTAFTTFFLLFWCRLWDCLLRAEAWRGSKDHVACQSWLHWLACDSSMDLFTTGSVTKSVGLWMGTPLGRTASNLQRLMVILIKLNIKCEWERRGVITERATQGTRGRLAQKSRVMMIVISGQHITPWYSQ